jgi:hypothetical protein
MEEKRKDLKATKQREIVARIVAQLNDSHPNFYYLPTTDIAHEISLYIQGKGNLKHDDVELVKDLSARDIQIMLSFHDDD